MASSEQTTSRPVVLVAIDWYLPAFRAGGPIRSIANLMAALGDEIDFRIVCGNRDLGTEEPLEVPNGWTAVGKAQVRYLSPEEWTAGVWQRLLIEVQPDRLYLNSLYSGPFSRLPWKVARNMDVPTTLAPRGMLGAGALSIKPWRKRLWLKAQRLTGRYGNLTWHASTEQEAGEIRAWFPQAEIQTALNLPVPFHPLPYPTEEDFPEGRPEGHPKGHSPSAIRLLSLGRVHPIKNYGFGLALAQSLSGPDRPVVYHIVGPLEDKEEAGRLQTQAEDMDFVQLKLEGPVHPHETAAHFGWAQLVLVPSFNENFGHAVAEAVACARPAIVSDQTAWSAMDPGDTVRCLPLDLDRWHTAARALLDLGQDALVESSRHTHARCLLSPAHLAAQRALFS
jgi:glycosyltransferase involved in cell wall biosynthesis